MVSKLAGVEFDGTNLKAAREQRRIKQSEVADFIGYSVEAYRCWENKGRWPASDALLMLSYLYGCSTDYLLGINDKKTGSYPKYFETLKGECGGVALGTIVADVGDGSKGGRVAE